MKLFEFINLTFLTEDKSDYVKKTFGAKLFAASERDGSANKIKDAGELVDQLLKIDPTPKKIFAVFLSNMYIKNQFRLEDAKRITNELVEFLRVKSKLENKDISSYKTLDDLYDALEPFKEKKVVTKAAEIKNIKKDVEKLIDTKEFKVIIPKTEAAAKFYGANTKWCTASDEDNMFDNYNEQGKIYIIITHRNDKDRKFQLHYESDQFMNERDQPLDAADIKFLSSFPEYKDFLNLLIKKHYEPHLGI